MMILRKPPVVLEFAIHADAKEQVVEGLHVYESTTRGWARFEVGSDDSFTHIRFESGSVKAVCNEMQAVAIAKALIEAVAVRKLVDATPAALRDESALMLTPTELAAYASMLMLSDTIPDQVEVSGGNE